MTGNHLLDAIEELGTTKAGMARMMNVHRNTMMKWTSRRDKEGRSTKIPRHVATIVALLLERAALQRKLSELEARETVFLATVQSAQAHRHP